MVLILQRPEEVKSRGKLNLRGQRKCMMPGNARRFRFKFGLMDLGKFITSMPPWALFGLVTVISLLSAEAGAVIGKRRLRKGVHEPEAPVGTAVSAMLGLLAFMLGFTFSITADRFADRKNLVIKQANAIATSYLRASPLPEKQKTEIRKIYRQYISLLTDIHAEQEIEANLAQMEELQLQLWQQTASLAEEDIDSELRSLFTASVNEVIDISSERETVGLIFRIPNALWTSLILLTIMSMFTFGYQTGINGSRRIFEMPLLPVAFALIIVLIADMDSTNQNRFKVSYEPLKNLKKLMNRELP